MEGDTKTFSDVRFSSDKNSLLIRWNDADLPFLNAIIRIMKAEVPALAIEEVDIKKTSPFFFQYIDVLQHRIQYIPVIYSDPFLLKDKDECTCISGTCNSCAIVFQCTVDHSPNERHQYAITPREVLSNDFKCAHEHIRLFPDIPIFQMNTKQSFTATATVRRRVARKETQFSVSAKSTFICLSPNKLPTEKADYEVAVESIGQTPPLQILQLAFQVLEKKILHLQQYLEKECC